MFSTMKGILLVIAIVDVVLYAVAILLEHLEERKENNK